jgi:hypothetical protein
MKSDDLRTVARHDLIRNYASLCARILARLVAECRKELHNASDASLDDLNDLSTFDLVVNATKIMSLNGDKTADS